AAAVVLHAVQRRDVRVVERRERARLALELAEALAIERQVLGQRLERDAALELGIAREIDDTHAAAPQLALDLEAAERARRRHGELAPGSAIASTSFASARFTSMRAASALGRASASATWANEYSNSWRRITAWRMSSGRLASACS